MLNDMHAELVCFVDVVEGPLQGNLAHVLLETRELQDLHELPMRHHRVPVTEHHALLLERWLHVVLAHRPVCRRLSLEGPEEEVALVWLDITRTHRIRELHVACGELHNGGHVHGVETHAEQGGGFAGPLLVLDDAHPKLALHLEPDVLERDAVQ